MATSSLQSFGDLLRRYRLAAGLTQEDLAGLAGLSVRGLSDLERGARRAPRRETVQLLAEALHLSEASRTRLEAAARKPGVPAASGSGSSPGGLATTLPLVGCAQELALLDRLLADGPPVLLVAGEPGIGKSRLLQAGIERAEAQGWTVLAGGCHRRSGQDPYAPLLSALADSLRRQSQASQRLHIQGCSWLVRLLPELAETRMLSRPSWTLPPEQERRLMFAAVAQYVANVAGPAGTLLVLDDLHWAGPDALDLLQALLRSPADRPLRLLAAYRNTDVAGQDPLALLVADLAREGRASRVELSPLAEGEASALLTELLPETEDGDPHLRQQVLARAGGVPLFLVSCVQALLTGHLSWNGASHVPWTLREAILQRVVALQEASQQVLRLAAVVGRRVPLVLLVAVAARANLAEEVVLDALEGCGRARLLGEVGGDAYQFTHDLIHEVVLADLGAARRALLHRRVAEALEQLPGDAPLEALAYHYTHSGEAEKASLYLERAGDAARSSYAYTEAADAYQQVVARLDTLGRGAQAAQIRERLGEVLGLSGRYDEALAVLEQAVAGYRAVNEQEGALRALAGIGYVHSKRGTMDEGLRRLQPVMEQLTTPDSSLGAASCYVALAYLSFGAEQYQQALAAALRAATMARALGDDHTLLAAQERQAAVLGILGKLSEGHQVLSHEVIPLAEALGETSTLIRALNNLGAISSSWGNYHEARHCVERALQLQKRLGNHKDVLFLQYQLGFNAFYTGEWQQAHAAYEQVVREVRAGARFWGHTYAFYGLGMLALAQGEEAAASGYFEEAALLESNPDINAAQDMEWALAERDLLADQPAAAYTRLAPFLSPSNQENIYAKEYLPRLAWAMLELGEDAQAQTLLAELVAEARKAQMRPVLSEALRVQAWAWSKQHRWEEAEQALEEALALAQDLPNPYAEAKTLYVAGLVSHKRKEFEPAIQRFEAALTILEQLGERLYARSIEQLLGKSETPAKGGEL